MTRSADDSVWIRRFHPAPQAHSRVVCFPHAGGSASYFFDLSAALSPCIEVLAIQYPGRQDRRSEPFVDTIEELADLIVGELSSSTDRRLSFFGHSMGASVAFEVARRLERKGIVLTALFASGRRAPSAHRNETVHLRDDEGLLAEVSRLSGTDPRLLDDDEVVRMLLPSIRNDYKAVETYRYQPGPNLNCSIVSLIGDSDPKVSVEEARAWADHTSGEFESHVFGGGHFYLNDHTPAILDLIRRSAL